MAKASNISLVPPDVREQLDKRLLRTGFGSLHEHVEWLKNLGYSVSKSGLHRYSQEAKNSNKVVTHIEKTMRPLKGSSSVDMVNLFIELGALRVREMKILALIDEAMANGSLIPEQCGTAAA